jgi:hypothetical protein
LRRRNEVGSFRLVILRARPAWDPFATAADDSGGFGFERARQIDSTILHGGREAKQNRGEQADPCAGHEDAPIDFTGQVHGHTGARGEKQDKGVAAPVRDEDSAGSAEGRENQGFGRDGALRAKFLLR